jgi:hypothetical protein
LDSRRARYDETAGKKVSFTSSALAGPARLLTGRVVQDAGHAHPDAGGPRSSIRGDQPLAVNAQPCGKRRRHQACRLGRMASTPSQRRATVNRDALTGQRDAVRAGSASLEPASTTRADHPSTRNARRDGADPQSSTGAGQSSAGKGQPSTVSPRSSTGQGYPATPKSRRDAPQPRTDAGQSILDAGREFPLTSERLPAALRALTTPNDPHPCGKLLSR